MDKRYQVFVSSTFSDLREERQQVIQALLELDCIPSGMELFPAADDDQWTLIKRVIDDCDYYVVIVAGRYGSLGPSGKSYTQMEYEYATSKGKPVIAFLHSDPSTLAQSKCEKTPDMQAALEEFRAFSKKRMCKYWTTAAELGSMVSRSLVQLIKSSPGIGWVRADSVKGETSILRLKNRLLTLEGRLADLKPTGLIKITTSPYSQVEWGKLFKGAIRLDLFFAYAQTWRHSHMDELERLSKKDNAVIRVALPDPEDQLLIAELARRSACSPEQMTERVYQAILHFLQLRQQSPHRGVVVSLTQMLPQFSLFRSDDMGVLSLYTHRRIRRAVVTMVFSKGTLMDYALTEFESVIEGQIARTIEDFHGIPTKYRP